MKQVTYTVREPQGIQIRPANQIVRIAKEHTDTVITMQRQGKTAKASGLVKLLRLGIKQGDTITVTAEGPSEDAVIIALSDYIWNNL